MLAGSFIGTWASSMVGSSTPNPNLKPYQAAIKKGQILLIVDVPANRAKQIADIATHGRSKQHNWSINSNEPDLELTMIV